MRVKTLLSMAMLAACYFGGPARSQQPPTPPTRSETYTLVDEKCRAERLRECVAGASFETPKILEPLATAARHCPAGFDQSAPVRTVEGVSAYLQWTCTVPASGAISLRDLVDAPDPVQVRLQRCASLAQGATLAITSPQCIRTVDTQRLIDTLERDIRFLLRELCQANQLKDCTIKYP